MENFRTDHTSDNECWRHHTQSFINDDPLHFFILMEENRELFLNRASMYNHSLTFTYAHKLTHIHTPTPTQLTPTHLPTHTHVRTYRVTNCAKDCVFPLILFDERGEREKHDKCKQHARADHHCVLKSERVCEYERVRERVSESEKEKKSPRIGEGEERET